MTKPTVPTGGDNARAAQATLRERVEATLRSVYDPEIPVNIFELGLIYALEVTDDGVVDIKMTLTAPNCPAAGAIRGGSRPRSARWRASPMPMSRWSGTRHGTSRGMSEAARLELGFM